MSEVGKVQLNIQPSVILIFNLFNPIHDYVYSWFRVGLQGHQELPKCLLHDPELKMS